MELEKIIELMKAFDQSSLSSFQLEQEGTTISMESNRGAKEVVYAPCNTTTNVQMEQVTIPSTNQEVIEGNTVKAPLVGTFYNASSPEEEAFVKVGDTVKKGQTLGIVEAMKLMNEIESEFDGVVEQVLVSNEDMVEYGQPLFVIR